MATDNLDFSVSPETVSILELSTGFRYNARATYLDPCFCDTRHVGRFAISYVTGSHAFKTGFTLQRLANDYGIAVNQDINYLFFRGVPNAIVQYASPWSVASRTKADLGIYVQDRWTIDRLALNLGLRMDYINGFVPEQDLPATRFISERSFDAVPRVPEWTDFNPRIGAAYDLFGNGGTAVKASVARYVGQLNANVASANNPINSSINAVTRQWADTNGDFLPDCDLTNFNPNGECGAITNQNFGQNRPNATLFNDDILRGRGTRDHFWDFIVEIEQQIGSSTSLAVAYNRTWTDNPAGLRLSEPQSNVGWDTGVTDNLAVTPEDYDPYCITAPLDPRLPGGGGYQVCGLYDIKPEKFGQGINEAEEPEDFRRSDTRLGLLQRDPVDARGLRSDVLRQCGYRTGCRRRLLCGRLAAATVELPEGAVVHKRDDRQSERQLSAPVRRRRRRGVPESAGRHLRGRVSGDERGNCAVARAQSWRVQGGDGLQRHGGRAPVWFPTGVRTAFGRNSTFASASCSRWPLGCGCRWICPSSTPSTAARCTARTTRLAHGGGSRSQLLRSEPVRWMAGSSSLAVT